MANKVFEFYYSHVTLEFKQLFIYSAQADIDEMLQVKIKIMIKQIRLNLKRLGFKSTRK